MSKIIRSLKLLLVLTGLLHSYFAKAQQAGFPNDTLKNTISMNVHFENVDNEIIRRSFLKVLRRYESLHPCKVTLIQKSIKSSTMQAQPVVGLFNLFGPTKKYKVKLAIMVRDSESMKVADLPEDVLTGWFAHELGHLVDYRPYSNFQMIFYGMKYVFSQDFKKEAEHAADRIAIQNGFRDEIISTKKFILEHDLLADEYKDKIRKYYMPIEEAEVWEHKHVPGAPEPDL